MGKPEHPLRDDVALYLRRPASDGERGREQEAVVPRPVGGAERSGAGEHSRGAGEVLGQTHDPLPVLVGEGLADRRLRPRRPALHRGGDRAQPDQPQQLGLDVELRQALAQTGVVDTSLGTHQREQVARRRPVAPQRAARRQRHPLVRQGDLGQLPAAVLLTDQVRRWDAHVVEEPLVEQVGARHLDDRAHLDAGRVHRAHEIRDALVLGHLGVGTGDEDAEPGYVGERRPYLLAVHDVDVAVAHGAGRQVGQVGAGARLAEQLAPHLLAREHRHEVAVLLRLRAGVQEGRPGPADADGVHRPVDAGAQHQDKFAQYLYNCPEYLESVFGACKAGLAPVNTNYRYADDELVYLWDNADVVAVAFHGCFTERIEGLRARVPRVRTWLWVDDGSGPCPDWAVP